MDVTMPEMDGVEAAAGYISPSPSVRVVMLTMHADANVVANAIRAGASGYLVKDVRPRRSPAPSVLAASGDTALSPQLASSMLDELRKLERPTTTTPTGSSRIEKEEVAPATSPTAAPPGGGGPAVHQPEDGQEPLASIYQKLDARDRTQAVLQACAMGIIHLD